VGQASSLSGFLQAIRSLHQNRQAGSLSYLTAIFTVAVVRPKPFVAYSVYVVDCVGEILALVPRTAPMSGDTIK